MIDLIVVGGGAAGYFGAINAGRAGARVVLLEGTKRPLTKVRISGGGRCNVTHHCFEPAELIKAYPRGGKELRGAFTRFAPRDTVAWFEACGVQLKTEPDGRMFPVTDDSSTIADCLLREAGKAGVEIRLGTIVERISRATNGEFTLHLRGADTTMQSRYLLLATGGMTSGHALARNLGHAIEPAIPSLFTFNVQDPRLEDLAGISFPHVEISLTLADTSKPLRSTGPLLLTHWGMSGPAVLKLSAFGAILLYHSAYQAEIVINFVGGLKETEVIRVLQNEKSSNPRRSPMAHPLFDLPKRFWQRLVTVHGLPETWADVSKIHLQALAAELTRGTYRIQGKGIFKDEFVTAGGVRRQEVDFRTMESRVCPGLFLAGEILDIDGITGGFNFQNAWTTSWLAAQTIGQRLQRNSINLMTTD